MSVTESAEKKNEALARLRIPRHEETRRSSRRAGGWKWIFIVALLLCAAAGGFVYAKQHGIVMGWTSDWLPDSIRSKPEVRVAKAVVVQGRAANAVVVATGYLESRRQAKIGARGAGRIESVNVEEGTKVDSGQVLAVLEHKDIDALLAAANATMERAVAELGELDVEIARTQNDYDRKEKLWQKKATTQAEFDQSRFARDAAVARRASLKAALLLAQAKVLESQQMQENMIVRAPFNGTVISKDAEVGESILPGGMGEASGRGSVVTIADLEHLEIECDVKEDYIGRVVEGLPAEVTVDAVPDVRFQGRVRKIIPMGDRARATIKVKVEILDADKRLFPEMSATAYFLTQDDQDSAKSEQSRVFCDSKAIQSEGSNTFVWQVDDESRTKRVDVKTGTERDGRTEILSGLKGGERVILDPPATIEARSLIKIREQ